jgi:hypothetical protein
MGDAQHPQTSVHRMRATRRRRREGFFGVVPLEVRVEEVDALLAHGLLNPAERADRGAIALAVGTWLDRTLERRQ